MTCLLPFLFFLLGLRRFIDIVGFIGAVTLGLEGIVLVVLYKEFLNDKFNKKINPAFYFLILIFILGIAFEIVHFLW